MKTILCLSAPALQEKSPSWDVPLSFHPLTLLFWVPMLEGSSEGGAGAAAPVAAPELGTLGTLALPGRLWTVCASCQDRPHMGLIQEHC